MARYYFDNNRIEELAFADLLDQISRDIRSGNVCLIEGEYYREALGTGCLTDRETFSIYFHRPSQEDTP